MKKTLENNNNNKGTIFVVLRYITGKNLHIPRTYTFGSCKVSQACENAINNPPFSFSKVFYIPMCEVHFSQAYRIHVFLYKNIENF